MRMQKRECRACGGRGYTVRLAPEAMRAARERAGLSLRELGRSIGVSAPYLSDIERGHRAGNTAIWSAYEDMDRFGYLAAARALGLGARP